MADLLLPGIDGTNPQGFMAGLGVLRALADRRDPNGPQPCLRWSESDDWRARIEGVAGIDQLADLLKADLETYANEPALQIAYEKGGARKRPGEKASQHDLKPPKQLQGELYRELRGRRSRTSRLMAAFGTEVVQDNNGNMKPTALHFTAGQQQFLKMVVALREGLTRQHLVEALEGPWRFDAPLPSLSWSGRGAVRYALRASDPSKEKRGSCPGAEWLAFLGLSFFPCVPRSGVRTRGVVGGWKDSRFTWPLWTSFASEFGIRALLRRPALSEMPGPARRALSIELVCQSAIERSDQGGYGSFTPAALL